MSMEVYGSQDSPQISLKTKSRRKKLEELWDEEFHYFFPVWVEIYQ